MTVVAEAMGPGQPGDPDPAFPCFASSRTLPPYRYVPGRNPHPIKHPGGHLYGGCEEVILWPRRDAWAACGRHLRAIDLFNHAYWWEAHEMWEGLWHAGPRDAPERIALKALIQAAAALLKRHLGHLPAAQRLAASALMGLEAAATHGLVRGGPCLGLDLVDFARRFDAHMADAREPYPHLRPAEGIRESGPRSNPGPHGDPS